MDENIIGYTIEQIDSYRNLQYESGDYVFDFQEFEQIRNIILNCQLFSLESIDDMTEEDLQAL